MHLTGLDCIKNGRHETLSYLVHPQIELKKQSFSSGVCLCCEHDGSRNIHVCQLPKVVSADNLSGPVLFFITFSSNL